MAWRENVAFGKARIREIDADVIKFGGDCQNGTAGTQLTITAEQLNNMTTSREAYSAAGAAKGALVYISGYNAANDCVTITAADADSYATRATHVVLETIAATGTGTIDGEGLVTGLDTSGIASAGDPVYLSTTAGTWQVAAPSGPNDIKQVVGYVKTKNATTGSIYFRPETGDENLLYITDITAGTVEAEKAVVVDASKNIGDFAALDAIDIDAGSSGVAGSVDVFPATASKGKLAISCANQTGNTTVTLNANAMGQATQVNLADPGAAASYVVQSTAAISLAEADRLDGAGTTVVASKAVIADGDKDIVGVRQVWIGQNGAAGFAGQINIQDGANPGVSSALVYADLNKIQGITNGTQAAGKAVVADANVNTGISKVTALHIGASGAEVQVTATPAELNVLAGVTAGTITASKALVVDAGSALAGDLSLAGTFTMSGVKRLILNGVASTGVTDGSVIRMGTSGSPLVDDQAGAGFVVGYFDSGDTAGWPAGLFISTNVTAAGGSFTALQGDAVLTAAKAVVTGIENFMQVSTGGRVTGACRSVQGTIDFSNEDKGSGGVYSAGCFNIKGEGASCDIGTTQRASCIELKTEGTFSAVGGENFQTKAAGYSIYFNGFTAASGVTNILSSTELAELAACHAVGIRVGVGADGDAGTAYYIPLVPATEWN